jgi:DNA polymerase-3 subunit chi
MIADFYHLSASPLERVLPVIADRIVAAGGRLLVVAEGGLLARLDEQLWSYARDSFLPHGRERPESQPVLLSADPVAANGAENIALADGRWRDEALAFARIFYFFDEAGREAAREAWRGVKGKEEVEARYWKQSEQGKWVQGP